MRRERLLPRRKPSIRSLRSLRPLRSLPSARSGFALLLTLVAAAAVALHGDAAGAATPGSAASVRTALPRTVGRSFLDARVPLNAIAVVVQEVGAPRPLVAHDAARPMNPASVMKLYTTLAALELLGRDYRWTTDAWLAGPLVDGTLQGDLVLKGRGDPKITIEQWQSFMAELRAKGLVTVGGDLVLDRSQFALPRHDAAAFDGEALRPYNVGPDAMLVNFKSVRFVFAPGGAGDATILRAEPPLPEITVGTPPPPAAGPCNDWRAALGATFADRGDAASASFAGRFPVACGERDWNVALLDHPHYVRGMFATYFGEAGGRFTGAVRDGRAPAGAAPFATMASAPLYDIVRDINKLSNNVMARQVFLTLATTAAAPPATPEGAAEVMRRWLDSRRIDRRGFVVENGSGLSRNERSSAAGLAQLLAAADASAVREEFASSLAVAAVDGTLARRFTDRPVAGQALLKTGSLEGVRALAGYVIDAENRRWIVVAIINHANALRGQPALDALVQWVYRDAAAWSRTSAR